VKDRAIVPIELAGEAPRKLEIRVTPKRFPRAAAELFGGTMSKAALHSKYLLALDSIVDPYRQPQGPVQTRSGASQPAAIDSIA